MVLFFTYKASIPKKKKINITITYVIITAIFSGSFIAISASEGVSIIAIDRLTSFSYIDFVSGFTMWGFHLRFDALFVLFILILSLLNLFLPLFSLYELLDHLTYFLIHHHYSSVVSFAGVFGSSSTLSVFSPEDLGSFLL